MTRSKVKLIVASNHPSIHVKGSLWCFLNYPAHHQDNFPLCKLSLKGKLIEEANVIRDRS